MAPGKNRPDFDDLSPEIQVDNQWIKTDDLVTLQVISFTPSTPLYEPLLILAGLAGQIISFYEIIRKLSEDTPVFYVETRDKSSSKVTGKVPYGIEAQSGDVRAIVEKLGFNDRAYSILGYSIGATIAVHCFPLLTNKPRFLTLLEPNATFDYPKWSLFAMRHAPVIGRLPIKIAIWYIGRYKIDREEDDTMYLISSHTIENADIRKLRQTALGIAPYEIWDQLEAVTCPTLIIGASKDRFHKHSEVFQMIERLRDSHYLDLETNKRSHSIELAQVITDFRKTLKPV